MRISLPFRPAALPKKDLAREVSLMPIVVIKIIGMEMRSRIGVADDDVLDPLEHAVHPSEGVGRDNRDLPDGAPVRAQQVEHEEIGHQIDRRRGVREVLKQLGDARLGASAARCRPNRPC